LVQHQPLVLPDSPLDKDHPSNHEHNIDNVHVTGQCDQLSLPPLQVCISFLLLSFFWYGIGCYIDQLNVLGLQSPVVLTPFVRHVNVINESCRQTASYISDELNTARKQPC
jgi:hypothetical protein